MKSKLSLFLIFTVTTLFAQNYAQQWNEHFSYLQISGIQTNQNQIIVSSKNAFFKYNVNTLNTINTTTINGLSGNNISYFYYSEIYELAILGYENGLLEIVNNENETTTIVDIINKSDIPGNQKKINHIYEYNGVIYLSCDYGISVYNLDYLEFGDTYYMGASGAQIKVNQTTIIDNFLYAATSTEGIRRALHADTNIIDFALWNTITPTSLTNWLTVVNLNNTLFAINNNKQIYSYNSTTFTSEFNYGTTQTIQDHRIHNNKMIVTTKDNVYLYDSPFLNTLTITHLPEYNSKFTVATLLNNDVFVGTENDGLLRFSIDGNLSEKIKPNGPLENNVFSITANNNKLWSVYGDHTLHFNPYGLDSKGFSLLNDATWVNTPYSEVFNAKSLVAIAINPFNESQVFISSFFSGLLEINEETPTTIWNTSNSALESLGVYLSPPNPSYIDIRIGKTAFDKNGVLWITNTRVDSGLKSYDPQNNVWESYSFSSIILNPVSDEDGFSDLVIDQNNTKWIGSAKHGVIAVSENGFIKNIDDVTGGLPRKFVGAVSIDKDNNLWIGTIQGLRVLYNTANFFTSPNPQAESIIILDDGIAKELLFGQQITDIETDGSNNKWIGTFEAGVFYLSPNGQQTIHHFTKDNSPLPSDIINDISIDSKTGKVYFATPNGMVSFNSNITEGNDNLDNVYAFPNPVKPDQIKRNPNLKVTIAGLKKNDRSNVKITDISGNLVFETTTKGGGTVQWDLTAFGKYKVASGVYIIMVTTKDGSESTTEKIMVIR